MANPGHSEDALREAVRAVRDAGGVIAHAAQALGVPYSTLANRWRAAQRAGLDEDPAIQDAKDAVGTEMRPVLAWAKTKSEDGTSYSVLLKPASEAPEAMAERLKAALEGMEPFPVVEAPEDTEGDLLTLYPFPDVHLGMLAWGRETGEDANTKKTARRMCDWMRSVVAASPASRHAIVLGVGDQLHADDSRNETPQSRHKLDVDTRHFLTLEIGVEAFASVVEAALAKHETVLVRLLPGNHDPHAYLAILFALRERYRLNERVQVECEPGEWWVHHWGDCFLAAHHGDKGKAEQMVMFLADRHAEIWGKARHRSLWTGHKHHGQMKDIGGMRWEQLRAITPKDAYAVAHAYSARAEMQAVTYHRTRGEVQRVRVGA